MRIMILSKACLVGSYQTKLEEIAKHDNIELTVIVPPSWEDPAAPMQLERSHTAGYQLIVDPIHFNGNYHLFYFPNLKKRLAEFRPDVLHIDEEPYNLATWLAYRQGRKVGAKTLFFSWQNIKRSYPPPFSVIEKQVLHGIDYAIMGNRDAVTVWRSKGYDGPFKVIPQFGTDPTMFSPPASRHNEMLTIGAANRRLVREKGVDLLLVAAAKLPGLWQLRIAGEGSERPYLEHLAQELGIAERVHFDGPVSSAEMPAYLQQLDVLVLSSRTQNNWKEQFGRILVEAMACEVAVVGAHSGEIPNVIGDAGLIFAEDDADALHEHLRSLLHSPNLRHTLGQKGRQRVLTHYTQAQIAAQTVSVYRDIIAN